MTTKITATELSRNLSDVLSRVQYQGESFVIERNGRPVAVLEPRRATWQDLVDLLQRHPVDDDFADDLEQAQRNQGEVQVHDWPD